ncbi:unnamed protein product [Vitrella brassicaformis CCMP3155]|uniref:RAP domain-containing protein n=2 Tax=Vitrella brassicaformis TaxID=1169539 RepID=A0A0G4EJN6_VITBC|nr:unnamed protein product [Vitrella brassicaformis CCMP3155]|mmetsp:Transcript_16281/g.46362  ORF Transcript_16281/g.46362 Transcript_16281/m.46362 type:complete len:551 (+) Transcript_16281:2-1654(+)|eukprot:CEL96972.1 unnamed protein product [Vitrella brassicaformis CCMP3155]
MRSLVMARARLRTALCARLHHHSRSCRSFSFSTAAAADGATEPPEALAFSPLVVGTIRLAQSVDNDVETKPIPPSPIPRPWPASADPSQIDEAASQLTGRLNAREDWWRQCERVCDAARRGELPSADVLKVLHAFMDLDGQEAREEEGRTTAHKPYLRKQTTKVDERHVECLYRSLLLTEKVAPLGEKEDGEGPQGAQKADKPATAALDADDILFLLKGLRELHFTRRARGEFFPAIVTAMRPLLAQYSTVDLIEVLDHLAALSIRGLEERQVFLTVPQLLSKRLDNTGEFGAPKPYELIRVFKAYSKARVSTELLRVLYDYVSRDLGEREGDGGESGGGGLLTPALAIHLLATMLGTRLYTVQAIEKLLLVARRTHLGLWASDSVELRSLKWIEVSLRLDYAQTYAGLSKEALEYLSLVRDLKYTDRSLQHHTILSYQLAHFLAKHSFPCKREMVGPYALKVCDRDERVAFEPIEKVHVFPDSKGKLRHFTETKLRHLEAMGWKVYTVAFHEWGRLRDYQDKADFVRRLLRENGLLGFPVEPRHGGTTV